MSTAVPTIPPRPSRAGPPSLSEDIPQIPPRPQRHLDRSQSPNRAEYTRSPLNELPISPNLPPVYHHRNLSASDLPERPPSVQLPSIGQEGDEYASLERTPSESTEQHRNVAADLPMHQPTASVPQATAKSRIQSVTRLDSSQPTPVSVGKASHPEDDKDSERHPLRTRASFNRSTPSLALQSRPGSIHEPQDHLGIPEIGVQVPMYPHAGDVQAPSPAPSAPSHVPGIGFFNDGSQRNHHRRRSSRQDLNPPGSYGMHGHGVEPRDQFERSWYQRHPEELAKELRHPYDPGHPRSEWALSSEELNKLVHGSLNRGLPPSDGPDEHSVYRASEEFASRGASPKPLPLVSIQKRSSNGSQTHVESPLRKASFPFNGRNDDQAVESEDEDSSARGRIGTKRGLKLANRSSNEEDGDVLRDDYGVPILASDELLKYPTNEYQQPAFERGDGYQSGYDSDHHHYHDERRGSSHQGKGTSRPTSAHGEPLSRLISHDRHDGSGVGTPLQEIQEYEPLFPDDDDKTTKPKPIHKSSRADLARHHFPSRDIWEDNPDSLRLTATVSTPELPLERVEEQQAVAQTFETPEKEAERKNGPIPSDRAHFLTKETERMASPRFKPGVAHEIPSRPGMQPRFPSSDIWEDTPDSMRLETTVSTPQSDEQTNTSPVDSSKPAIPARPVGRSKEASTESTATGSSPPDRKAPIIPDRPKPTVPARPAAKGIVAGGTAAADSSAPKAKPVVPSRPAGKLASIKASFMNDLNSRLQLGPQVVKKEEPKEEAAEPAPLADARKSRARGPARRKPAAATETVSEPSANDTKVIFAFSTPCTWFRLDADGLLEVATVTAAKSVEPSIQSDAAEHSAVPAEAVGTEGDLPEPSISQGTLNERKEIEPLFHEALASTAKAPETEVPEQATLNAEPETAAKSVSTSEQQTQTGGHAQSESNVVVKADGTEEVGQVNSDTPRRVGQTGHGM